jgi:hypothetical protein
MEPSREGNLRRYNEKVAKKCERRCWIKKPNISANRKPRKENIVCVLQKS